MSKWTDLIKKKYEEIKKEGKLKGAAIMKAAMKAASIEWKAAKAKK